jgi:tetratricopeptide (TPR) repeat protein
MSRKREPRKPTGRQPGPDPGAATRLRVALALGAFVLVAAALAAWLLPGRESTNAGAVAVPAAPPAPPPPEVAKASYVGREACAGCHAQELAKWQGSHHDLAMQEPDEASVLGDFGDAKFRHAGVTSTFFQRDGKYFVRTDGPDGKLADFAIRYTFGVDPLQQYLIELPGGRLQALSIAWDARPRAQGGQRWFHLYPVDTPPAGDSLHWTGLEQNWNFMCAECHSTDLRKNFDAATQTFATAFAELDVSCEACHGPASNHVAWARREGDTASRDGDHGFAFALDERRNVVWTIDPATGNAQRSRPRETAHEVELCGRCHARASRISDDYVHGAPLLDSHRVALLEEGLYWSDGQMRAEVYDHGSFLQSRMFAEGVTCSDCHEPHSLKLREPGDAVCAQCHAPARYASAEHHFHPPGSAGAACAACHMPVSTYMLIDPRHDHSLRIPRPDRSTALGVPNACSGCHVQRSPEWAAAEIRRRHPQPKPGYQGFAEAFHADSLGDPRAQPELREIVKDAAQPAIVRASAARRLSARQGPPALETLARALRDPDPLVRFGATLAAARAEPVDRARLLLPVLDDRVLAVRSEAARALAAAPQAGWSAEQRAALARGVAEWTAAQEYNADRPEGHANLGMLSAERGASEQALSQLAQALALDPTFTPASVNRADLLRALGRDAEAESALREALARSPRDAALHHILGLVLIRLQKSEEALRELAEAARLAPEISRFGYAYAIGLHDYGRMPEAQQALEALLRRHPNDVDALFALVSYLQEAGEPARALPHARRLAELQPQDARTRALVGALEAR